MYPILVFITTVRFLSPSNILLLCTTSELCAFSPANIHSVNCPRETANKTIKIQVSQAEETARLVCDTKSKMSRRDPTGAKVFKV